LFQDRREKRLAEEIEKFRAENPKITEQFADLKRKLADVTEEQWEAIPEIGDYTIKNKKRMESFAPVPDTLLAKAAAEKQSTTTVNTLSGPGGLETPGYATTDLTAIGEGRGTVWQRLLGTSPSPRGGFQRNKKEEEENTQMYLFFWLASRRPSLPLARRLFEELGLELPGVDPWLGEPSGGRLLADVRGRLVRLGMQMQVVSTRRFLHAGTQVIRLNLDRMADSVTGQTVVDPKGYLTDLKSMKITSDAEVSDIKKARTLLKSVTNTNPRHAPGWIAAARLEELVMQRPTFPTISTSLSDTRLWLHQLLDVSITPLVLLASLLLWIYQ
jgi:pre-mRNA-processing factor 6